PVRTESAASRIRRRAGQDRSSSPFSVHSLPHRRCDAPPVNHSKGRQIGRMRQHRVVKRITLWRTLCSIAAVAVVAVGAALSSSDAQGRVDPSAQQPTGSQLSADTVAIVTGGGTVTVTGVPDFVASFGLPATRPAGFTGGGAAQGRINYDRHTQMASRHVNVPVTLMSAELAVNPSPNGTGGRAQIVGDCTAPATECPTGFSAVL